MKVVALAPYPPSAPSTRFRLAQFRPHLESAGVQLEIRPFLDEEEFRVLPERGVAAKARILTAALARRIRDVTSMTRPDVVVVHRELAPVLQGRVLSRLRRRSVPIIFDFDDAVFLPPRGGDPLMRLMRRPRRDTTALVSAAARVWAGNPYLASFAAAVRGTGDGVRVLPSVVDHHVYRPRPPDPARDGSELPVLGWMGTHTTGPYLEAIAPALRRLRQLHPFRLLVVSNRPPRLGGIDVDFRPWSETREVRDLQEMDIGLYPLPDDEWTRGKCGFKAIQYMACGVPVVASPVGVLREMIADGVRGFHAPTEDAWVHRLGELIRDPGLRARMGSAGRAYVVERLSVDAVWPAVLEDLGAVCR